MLFVYLHAIWFGIWIVVNMGWLPIQPFDPFPFGLLTMIVSLLAIFLSLFVLISQNRQTEREKVRNDIEYEVNVKAELEIRDLRNICIVVCEQVLSFVLDVADRLLVMENGRIVHTDTRKNVDEAAVARFLAV